MFFDKCIQFKHEIKGKIINLLFWLRKKDSKLYQL